MFTVTLPSGVSITCESSAAVRDLLTALELAPTKSKHGEDEMMFAEVKPAFQPRTGAFLRRLQQVRPMSLDANVLAELFHAKSVKGVGPITTGIKNELVGLGFDPDDAFVTVNTANGPRWAAGPGLDDILEKGGLGK